VFRSKNVRQKFGCCVPPPKKLAAAKTLKFLLDFRERSHVSAHALVLVVLL